MIEYVQFFPTLRCNQQCSFCFVRGISESDFPISQIENFIQLLKTAGIQKLDILGGEPFLYGGLKTLVSLAVVNNIEVTVSSNGSFLKKLEQFLRFFRGKRVYVGISINGKVNKKLLNLIKSHKLWIKSVIRKDHFPEQSLLLFTKEVGITFYLIYFDAITPEDLKLSIPFPDYLEKVRELQFEYKNIEPVYCKGFIGGGNYRCPAGTEKITVMPNGDVYPCYLLVRLKEYRIGNIFIEPIERILSSSKLNLFKERRVNPCERSCELKTKCHGGCIAHSIIHYSSSERADPRCGIIC